MPDRNITFEIKEYLGTIAKYDTNWRRELNIISWNGGAPKFDIRDWDEGHVKMSKGITLSMWEMRNVVDLYIARNNERAVARGRAAEEERNALRAASFRPRQETSGLDDETAAKSTGQPVAEEPPSAEEMPFDESSGETEVKEEAKEEMEEIREEPF